MTMILVTHAQEVADQTSKIIHIEDGLIGSVTVPGRGQQLSEEQIYDCQPNKLDFLMAFV